MTTKLSDSPPWRSRFWNWLGVGPFFLFAIALLILPSTSLFVGSFQDNAGAPTLANFRNLLQPNIVDAYWLSIRVSAVTALGGGLLGFLLAYAITLGHAPAWLRALLTTFSGVASNFAGVPLAFAFVSTLGRTGFVTVLLADWLGFNLYRTGFTLYSFAGLSLTYLYFQFPLMVLIMTPALEGLKREWREAADNLGATGAQYWRLVGLPILLPSLLGAMILLFGNAFGAYATALALTGGRLNLVTILIGAQIRGDVLHDPNLGYALALGMVVIMGLSIALYSWLQRRAERWLR
ncbi:MAG: ABC transporter permease subunit [Caldilineaceae bacterium]|nr:ABC transporter permease subunit [Caldilineaceae bacterium]